MLTRPAYTKFRIALLDFMVAVKAQEDSKAAAPAATFDTGNNSEVDFISNVSSVEDDFEMP